MSNIVPGGICACNWFIVAICKHIEPQEALAGARVAVGVEESSEGWVTISALEVIEARLCIVVVAIGAKIRSIGLFKKQRKGS